MTVPDPDSIGWMAKVTGVVGAITAPVVWLNSRLNNKADKEEVAKCLKHIETLYQNAESDRKTVSNGFQELYNKLHDTHIDLIGRIDQRSKRRE